MVLFECLLKCGNNRELDASRCVEKCAKPRNVFVGSSVIQKEKRGKEEKINRGEEE